MEVVGKAVKLLNLVEQYYEYTWNDDTFGLDEHTWLKYVGVYKNLIRKTGSEDAFSEVIKPLVGKTKLAGTQVIDAAHILELIGLKVSNVDGFQAVDGETLRIIYEQIQELSDIGEDNRALLLKEFVDKELVPGKLSSTLNFDEAFDLWKQKKRESGINELADSWGIDRKWLYRSVNSFSTTQPKIVPYIDEISKSVNYEKATDKSEGNRLKHIMTLTRKLPEMIIELKREYE